MFDAYSDIDIGSLSVVASFAVNGWAAGEEHGAGFAQTCRRCGRCRSRLRSPSQPTPASASACANRFDTNHRYTTDTALKAQMVAGGHIAEGYGANAVAMCSPQ